MDLTLGILNDGITVIDSGQINLVKQLATLSLQRAHLPNLHTLQIYICLCKYVKYPVPQGVSPPPVTPDFEEALIGVMAKFRLPRISFNVVRAGLHERDSRPDAAKGYCTKQEAEQLVLQQLCPRLAAEGKCDVTTEHEFALSRRTYR